MMYQIASLHTLSPLNLTPTQQDNFTVEKNKNLGQSAINSKSYSIRSYLHPHCMIQNLTLRIIISTTMSSICSDKRTKYNGNLGHGGKKFRGKQKRRFYRKELLSVW